MNKRVCSLGRLDHFREYKYLLAVHTQLTPNQFVGDRSDMGCSSPISLQSPRITSTFFPSSLWGECWGAYRGIKLPTLALYSMFLVPCHEWASPSFFARA